MFGLNEAILSFLRRQIGLRTDSANSSGSVHAKLSDLKNRIDAVDNVRDSIFTSVKPSDTVRVSKDVQQDIEGMKAHFFIPYSGRVRITCEVIHYGTGLTVGMELYVYVNTTSESITRVISSGNAIGDGDPWVPVTIDVNVIAGDAIMIRGDYSKRGGYIRNIRLKYDTFTIPGVL